jgi:proteasome lid subunit RPN8/RPN11
MRDVANATSAVAWPGGIADVVRAEAERAYPDECCGLLLGRHDTLLRAEPIANGEEPTRRRAAYLLSPGAFRRAEAQARAEGLDVVGVFHSHPDHPARPSPTDLEAAWPGWVYVIVPVEQGRAGTPLAWRLRDDRSGFDHVPLWHKA